MCSYIYLEHSLLTTARSGRSTVRGLLIHVNVFVLKWLLFPLQKEYISPFDSTLIDDDPHYNFVIYPRYKTRRA
jgi:hypothetical protein